MPRKKDQKTNDAIAKGLRHICILDSTLRDGAQGPGVTFSMADKLRLAESLDAVGVDFIEGGWPGSNPKEQEFFAQMKKRELRNAKLVAFGFTCRSQTRANDDKNLLALLDAGTEYVSIVGKSSAFQVQNVLGVTLEENLSMIAETLDFLKKNQRRIFFDAEHFFDGYQEKPEYTLKVLLTAVAHGAECLVLCDTNGGTLPGTIADVCTKIRCFLPENIALGIHCHNDAGCAVANSLLAVQAGCTQVQGCINGFGERCGNADLCSIIPALSLKMGYHCLKKAEQLSCLTNLSQLFYELTVQRAPSNQPYVGKMAFCHKAGTHINAVKKNPRTFEHVQPESVGNQRHFLLSEHSGTSSILEKAREQHLDLSQDEAQELLNIIKSKEAAGYSFEAADASFKLLAQRQKKLQIPHFALEGFRVIVEKRSMTESCLSEATVKVNVNGQSELTASEGDGPVDALDLALRKALSKFYPELAEMRLRDFKVRILDGSAGTAARTRVLIESAAGNQSWGTVGFSENIIEASWQALLDSIEFFLDSRRTTNPKKFALTAKNNKLG